MSNIREVSRLAGVSTATVSRALRNPELVSKESRRKVMEAVERLNYRPNMLARNFRSERSYSLVILTPSIASPFYSRVIRGVELAAQNRGYSVLLGDTRDSLQREHEYIELVETRLADGIIQFRPSEANSEIARRANFPIVYACGCADTALPSVRIDNVEAARTVVNYFLSLGHRRIATICGQPENPHSIDRLIGYREALQDAGIAEDPDLIVHADDYSMQSGVKAGTRIAQLEDRPTALFCMNDEIAIGAIQSLKRAGFAVPADVSVAGFDNIDFARHYDPPLTTIDQPSDDIGRMACNMLIDQIEGRGVSQNNVVLDYDLIVRTSSGPVSDG